VLEASLCALRIFFTAALAATVLSISASALAQGDDMSRAKEAFSRGQAAYDSGRYDEARTAFEESFAAFPHFRTLFNIALCEEKLGDVQGAVDMYQRYVDWPSEVPNREEVSAKLAELKALLPPEPAPPAPPVAPNEPPKPSVTPPTKEHERGPDLRVPGWITVGTGAAGAVVGAVFLGLAQKKKKEMEAIDGELYDPSVHDAMPEDGRRYQKIGWVVGGFGVLAAAVGTVLLIASDDGHDTEVGGEKAKAKGEGANGAAIVPIVGPETVAAAVQWRF
jgi:tetratricopeptide (TPR) repeat protein